MFHGLVLVDKPKGWTSHDVVGRARKILGTSQVGHGGTLDPMASGLLVLLVGEATKLSHYILNGDKGYQVKIQLGLETDSFDITGKEIRRVSERPSKAEIEKVIESMTGELDLEVPKFSAVKVDGKVLHREARQGRPVETPVRRMKFFDFSVIEINENDFTLKLRCSKGSYIRSWAQEAGRRLGVGACVEELRRIWSEPYTLEQAQTLEELARDYGGNVGGNLDGSAGGKVGGVVGADAGIDLLVDAASAPDNQRHVSFVPLTKMLPHWPSIVVDGKDKTLLLNGQISYGLRGRLRPYYHVAMDSGARGLKIVSQGQKSLLALITADEVTRDFAIARVFNTFTFSN